MLTGVLLDGDVFSNVEVSNGKLVNDGDRIIAAGLAFPGLQENLGIDSEKPRNSELCRNHCRCKEFQAHQHRHDCGKRTFQQH